MPGHVRAYPVSHRTIATLPLVPRPQKRGVTSVNEIDDPHIGLAGVLSTWRKWVT